MTEKFDYVVTWVNSDDIEWKQEYSYYTKLFNMKSEINEERYLSHGEIIYNILLARSMPFINNIFLVTNHKTLPFLQLIKDCNVICVHHKNIFPKLIKTPTFKSTTIETFLWNIPELSEYFIYANDDMFLLDPDCFHRFFDIEQKCIHIEARIMHKSELKSDLWLKYNIANGIYLMQKKFPNKNIPFLKPQHLPCLLSKTVCQEAFYFFQSELLESCRFPFRGINRSQTINPIWLYSLYHLYEKNNSILILKDHTDVRMSTDNLEYNDSINSMICINKITQIDKFHSFFNKIIQINYQQLKFHLSEKIIAMCSHNSLVDYYTVQKETHLD